MAGTIKAILTIKHYHKLFMMMDAHEEKSLIEFPNMKKGLSPGTASIFIMPTHKAPSTIHLECLNKEERNRFKRFKCRYSASSFGWGRYLLRHILASLMDINASEVPISVKNGNPSLDSKLPYDFNLSHCTNYLLFGVANGGQIGVDIEQDDKSYDSLSLALNLMSLREYNLLLRLQGNSRRHAFLRLWVRREAWLKMIKKGFSSNNRDISCLRSGGITNTCFLDGSVSNQVIWSVACHDHLLVSNINLIRQPIV